MGLMSLPTLLRRLVSNATNKQIKTQESNVFGKKMRVLEMLS